MCYSWIVARIADRYVRVGLEVSVRDEGRNPRGTELNIRSPLSAKSPGNMDCVRLEGLR